MTTIWSNFEKLFAFETARLSCEQTTSSPLCNIFETFFFWVQFLLYNIFTFTLTQIHQIVSS